MTFKRFIFHVFAALILFSSCKKNNHFTISGKITHAEGDTIYLKNCWFQHETCCKSKIDKKVNLNLKEKRQFQHFIF